MPQLSAGGYVSDKRGTPGLRGTEYTYGKRSLLNQNGSVLAYGLGVVRATATGAVENGAVLPSAAGQEFRGVVGLSSRVYENALDSNGRTGVEDKRDFDAQDQGDVWVFVDATVAAGDDVYLRHSGTAADIGKFRNNADTANASQITGAYFLTAGNATTPAKVYLTGAK